jgi:hypothetical protein
VEYVSFVAPLILVIAVVVAVQLKKSLNGRFIQRKKETQFLGS